MVNRKQMPSLHPGKTTLKDVLACFSEEERKLLREWQNVLYKNVMNEIHQALLSLGPAIAASIFSLQAEENEENDDLDHADVQGLERRNIDHDFLNAAISNEDVLNKIMREPEASLHTDSMKTGNLNPVLTSTRLKDEEGTVTIVDQDAKEIQDIIYPTGFPSLAHESEVSYMNSTDGEGREDGRRASQGHEARTMVTSVFIKEEEATDPTALMDHKERQDMLGSAGFSSFTSEQVVRGLDRIDEGGSESWIGGSSESEGSKILLPPSFKEELTDSTGDQDSTEMPYISYPLGFPSPTSEPAVSYVDPIGGGGEGSSRASPGNQNRRNPAEEDRIRVKQEERLEFAHDTESGALSEKESHTWLEGNSFTWKPSFKQHKRVAMMKKRFPCTECKKRFKNTPLLAAHQRVHKQIKPLTCMECGKEFPQKSQLQQHLQTHKGMKPSHCTDCEKSFTLQSSPLQHRRTHPGVMPFHCTECDIGFTLESSLVRHQRVHTGFRPFSCTSCEKHFTRRDVLLVHQKIHTLERSFHCTECEKCFTQKSSLHHHQKIHSLVRAFRCTECEKSFTRKSTLLQHQKIHTGVKAFQCNKCEKGFFQKSHLLVHQRKHTELNSFTCTVCQMSYGTKPALMRHKKTHTGSSPFH